jgi:hypothetical protein
MGTDRRQKRLNPSSNLNDKSSIDKTLRGYEEDLLKKLRIYYDDYIVHQINAFTPPEVIHGTYGNFIRMQLRGAITKGYFHGIDVVSDHLTRNINGLQIYPTGTDINNIRRLSEAAEKHYWYNISRLFHRAHYTKADDKPANQFDIKASLQDVAIKSVYGSYSEAVKSKYPNALGLLSEEKVSRTAAIGNILDALGLTRSMGIALEWTTAGDSKVCNTGTLPYDCKSQERKRWSPIDPDIPEMPAHTYCRCFWTPVEDKSIDWLAILNLLALGILGEEQLRGG